MPGGCSHASTGALMPSRAQRERLVDGGNTEFGGAGGQRGARDRRRAVPVAVGLDNGHHLCVPGVLAQHAHVVRDSAEVHHGLGEDAGRTSA